MTKRISLAPYAIYAENQNTKSPVFMFVLARGYVHSSLYLTPLNCDPRRFLFTFGPSGCILKGQTFHLLARGPDGGGGGGGRGGSRPLLAVPACVCAAPVCVEQRPSAGY